MIHEIPNLSDTGVQAGSVLFCVQKVLGRSRALETLEYFRGLWTQGQSDQPNVGYTDKFESLKSFKVLADAPGVLAFEKPQSVLTEEACQLITQELKMPVTVISRLDQVTSGIVPVALGAEGSSAANWLRAQWAGRLVSKEYICLTQTNESVDVSTAFKAGATGEIDKPLRPCPSDPLMVEVTPQGRPARTTRQKDIKRHKFWLKGL